MAKKKGYKEQNELLNKAIIYAVEKHAGQLRKGTQIPYIVHPMEVLALLNEMRADMTVIIAGVLHDTVEDTSATIDDIIREFGEDVAELVGNHTEDKSKTWFQRKSQGLRELAEGSFDLKCLVLADKLSNVRNMHRDYMIEGDEYWDRFNAPFEKQAWYYNSAVKALEELKDNENTAVRYNEFKEIVENTFGHVTENIPSYSELF
ncbi:MAG: bifunctional (p)ppGpp synthetase/guanosine-3',5'-bis(diphosphate) 3'-pyrophosphohydrolase [Firmicutes bacterium]|nr:bifunctional (p)ppGpp synthetase/guanosine-3',5'-bis(diphosphate) 3'-pyrophosphohydrolase [Bacillota bacterium]